MNNTENFFTPKEFKKKPVSLDSLISTFTLCKKKKKLKEEKRISRRRSLVKLIFKKKKNLIPILEKEKERERGWNANLGREVGSKIIVTG